MFFLRQCFPYAAVCDRADSGDSVQEFSVTETVEIADQTVVTVNLQLIRRESYSHEAVEFFGSIAVGRGLPPLFSDFHSRCGAVMTVGNVEFGKSAEE